MFNSKYIQDNNYFSLSKTVYRKGHICPPHNHKEVAISVVLNGVVHETVDSSLKVGQSAVTIIKPAEIVHQNIFTEECIILCLQLKDMAKHKLKYNNVLEEWKWMNGLNCLPHFMQILNSKTEKEVYENTSTLLQYINLFKHGKELQIIPDWLLSIKEYIDHNWANPINVTDIAKTNKIHRVYLARVFQKYYGQSIKSYLKALRVHHSAASIINGSSLSDAAFANGFSDQCHLQRNFKQVLTQTPAEFKRQFI